MSKNRLFPIQGASPIPWSVAEKAYEVYEARFRSNQTLERLAERGGFHVDEMDAFYPEWRAASQELILRRGAGLGQPARVSRPGR